MGSTRFVPFTQSSGAPPFTAHAPHGPGPEAHLNLVAHAVLAVVRHATASRHAVLNVSAPRRLPRRVETLPSSDKDIVVTGCVAPVVPAPSPPGGSAGVDAQGIVISTSPTPTTSTTSALLSSSASRPGAIQVSGRINADIGGLLDIPTYLRKQSE